MKSFFKKLAFVMALAMVVSLAAPAATAAVAAEEVKIAYQNGGAISEVNLAKVGDVEDLKFTGAPDYKEVGFNWSSSNPAVATVNQNGEVTAVAAGSATITIAIGTDRTATVKVNVVDLPTYTAFMGETKENPVTALDFVVGDEPVDLAFFGIKDYDAKRYVCDWLSADDEIATVDNKGVITPVAPGKTKVTLSVKNFVTGVRHTVDYCVVTVSAPATPEPTATPVPTEAPQPAIVATQTTYKEVEIALNNMPAVDASSFEVYAVYGYDAAGKILETVWQTTSVDIDADKNVATLVGYYAFEDGQEYVVRCAGEETTFTASVGAVTRVELGYNSYKNNQGKYAFKGVAVTNGIDGEEIVTDLYATLYDAKNIDVTGYYDDPVRFELVNYDNYLVNLDSYNGTLTFNEVGEIALIKAIYNDSIESPIYTVRGEQAPAYQVVSIDEWSIVRAANKANADEVKKVWANPIHSIALNDDNDDNVVDAQECDYWIVAKFVDNYGNKYVTDGDFQDTVNKYWAMDDNSKFCYEGYEVRFESANPQVLVISDDTGFITTKRVGNAVVNAFLYNDLTGTNYVKRISALQATVKAERVLTSVSVNTVDLTTATDEATFPEDFTTAKATIVLKDQYGEVWGKYNSYRGANTDVVVSSKGAVTTEYEGNHTFSSDKIEIVMDGLDLASLVATKKNIYYTVVATDTLTNVQRKAEFRVDLNSPILDKTTSDIIPSERLTLIAENTGLINTNWWEYGPKKTTIKLIETSNGLGTNYYDEVVLITPTFDFTDATLIQAVKDGDVKYGFVVTYSDGTIVDTVDNDPDKLGIKELTEGKYEFHVSAADVNNELHFVKLGKYTVKVVQLALNEDEDEVLEKGAVYKKVITVSDNRSTGKLVAQNKIDTDEFTPEDVVVDAFTFKTNVDLKAGKGYQSYITNVEYRLNRDATAMIIEDVYLKIFVGDSAYYYVVKVPVYKTVGIN